jgi:hypothetical protein
MSLYEKFLKMPVWKVLIIIAMVFFMFMVMIEELFIGRVFSLMDKGATYFEKIKAEDLDDLEEDRRDFARRQKEDNERYQKSIAEQNEKFRKDDIQSYCKDVIRGEHENKALSEWQTNKQRLLDSEAESLTRQTPTREANIKRAKEGLIKLGIDYKNCHEYYNENY